MASRKRDIKTYMLSTSERNSWTVTFLIKRILKESGARVGLLTLWFGDTQITIIYMKRAILEATRVGLAAAELG